MPCRWKFGRDDNPRVKGVFAMPRDRNLEGDFISEMTSLSLRILEPGGRRIYDLLIEGVAPFTDLFEIVHPASAYQMWAAMSDLVDASGTPESEMECERLAKEAARDWLAIDDGHSFESTEAYFQRWLSRMGVE